MVIIASMAIPELKFSAFGRIVKTCNSLPEQSEESPLFLEIDPPEKEKQEVLELDTLLKSEKLSLSGFMTVYTVALSIAHDFLEKFGKNHELYLWGEVAKGIIPKLVFSCIELMAATSANEDLKREVYKLSPLFETEPFLMKVIERAFNDAVLEKIQREVRAAVESDLLV